MNVLIINRVGRFIHFTRHVEGKRYLGVWRSGSISLSRSRLSPTRSPSGRPESPCIYVTSRSSSVIIAVSRDISRPPFPGSKIGLFRGEESPWFGAMNAWRSFRGEGKRGRSWCGRDEGGSTPLAGCEKRPRAERRPVVRIHGEHNGVSRPAFQRA